MSKNFMHIARLNKNDEFYTQYEDILNEVTHYKDKFINKIIYCNCDTEDSNFYKIFKIILKIFV
ncbi:putative adenine-specific DNA methyl-transferase [Campylobacter phage F336]|uniref:Putative adenine-specific DNA methyl-transferase n=1 Tax=Campylobacter phage F336 TaxID=2794361 RepID=A0A7T3KD81_9CAUD|nr:putative adenine-specific DNA methyl-transferase [Campylobacter phage F336]